MGIGRYRSYAASEEFTAMQILSLLDKVAVYHCTNWTTAKFNLWRLDKLVISHLRYFAHATYNPCRSLSSPHNWL
jgi:hypothetical protein